MAILDIQKRARELGRIRIGDRVAAGKGDRPNKLDRPRLTSPSKALIEQAARVYGGEVKEWASPAGPQWQVYVTADAIDVILPPGEMALDQHYELWSGGGCQRRCDGEVDSISDAPCACPDDPEVMQELAKEGQACKPTTRLKVMLPDVGDLGLWRLETHGYHAAAELAGTLEILRAGGLGRAMLRGTIRIDQRVKKIAGEPPRRFIVPVLELADVNVRQLVDGSHQAIASGAPRAIAAPKPPELEGPKPLRIPPAAAAPAAPPAPPTKKRARRAEAAGPGGRTEPPSQPRANADGEVLATLAQIRKLMVLSERRGYSDEERRAAAGVASFKDLTKDRASKLIDEWETGEATPTAAETDEEWEDAFGDLRRLLDEAFPGQVSKTRYRDTLLARYGHDSLEDLSLEELKLEAEPLRKRVSA